MLSFSILKVSMLIFSLHIILSAQLAFFVTHPSLISKAFLLFRPPTHKVFIQYIISIQLLHINIQHYIRFYSLPICNVDTYCILEKNGFKLYIFSSVEQSLSVSDFVCYFISCFFISTLHNRKLQSIMLF